MKPLSMHVTADSLHVRTDASRESESLGFFHGGLAIAATEIDGTGTWAKVTANGVDGWCSLKYLLPAGAERSPWLAVAQKEIGVKEVSGSGDHPRILEYMATVDGLSGQQDEIAWCSCFVNWCVEKSGHNGTNSAMAQSWNRWRNGKPAESVLPGSDTPAQLGDIAVGQRKSAESGLGHVGFFMAYDQDEKKLLILGGNQSNAVRYQWYPLASANPYGRLLSLRSL